MRWFATGRKVLPALLIIAAAVMPGATLAAPNTKPAVLSVVQKKALPSSIIAPKKLKAVSNVLSAIRNNSALSKPLTEIRAKSASGKSLSEQVGRLSKVKKPISLDYIKRVHNEEYAGKVFPASKLSKTFSKRYPAGIKFNERGYPDLSQYATKTVQIEPQGNSAKDARAADIAAGFTKDNPRPGRYYWYHSEQNGTLQLVPKDMIGALRRTSTAVATKPSFRADTPYSARSARDDLENIHGRENIASSTTPPSDGRNVHLANKRHPVTGIVFDNRGFPIFDDVAAFDTRLSDNKFKSATYEQQMKMSTKDLADAINGGQVIKSKFTSRQLNQIEAGAEKIDGYTWHHHQESGRMQLVPEVVHQKTGHIGGEAMSKGI